VKKDSRSQRRPWADAASRPLPLILLLFAASGCAALIYEIIWFQLLQLVIGSSSISLGVLLGVFMGGMCLGSWLAPRLLAPTRHPLRVFAALELGIGVMALLILWGLPIVSGIYTTLGSSLAVRLLLATVCLLPPTLMMGATLPAVSRWVSTSSAGLPWIGGMYGANLVGAVAGSLLAGFYLLRVYDMAIATYAGVAINVAIALAASALAGGTAWVPLSPAAPRTASARSDCEPGAAPEIRRRALGAIALSGLTALACEVVWTRLLSLAFGATVYAFALILAVFLFGLGVGSGLGSLLLRRAIRPLPALGWIQILICPAIAWASFMLTQALPYWPNPEHARTDLWLTFQLDLIRSLIVVLPAAVLWGCSFPLAVAAISTPGQDPARVVGGVYAANTIGAIAGALGTSLILVGTLGSQHTQQALMIVAALAGVLALSRHSFMFATAGALVAAALALTVQPVPGLLAAYGRRSAQWAGLSNIVYSGEGRNSFVAVTRASTGVLNYHAAGKVQASVQAEDMRLQRMLGHLSHLIPRTPRRVLVIGCGAGVTAGAVSLGPGVERLTIAEIEPLAPEVAGKYFGDYNYHVIDNPKVSVRIDDGRHFLMTTDEKFDVITTDLIDPWVKGVATLFTREFFESARQHLNPGGVVTQFVQLYQSNTETVKSEIGTFVSVFPNTVIWGNTNNGQGYDLVLLGQVDSVQIDIDALQARLDSPAYAEVAQSLREIGFSSAVQLMSTYAASALDLAPWLSDAAVNRDRNLRLQYLAGLGFNLYQSDAIYRNMIKESQYPEGLFTGSPQTLTALRETINQALGR
jgi:spermidine synthase